MTTVTMVFGVAGVLLLLTSAYVEGLADVAQISGYVGQRVELPVYCRRKAYSDVNEIYWHKNDAICFRFGFKEDPDYEVIFSKSYAKLVIPSVAEKDAGLYQCGKSSQLANLTVLKIVQNMSAESSDNSSMLQNMLSGIYSLQLEVKDYILDLKGLYILWNSIVLIVCTLLIGAVIFLIQKWWKGKCNEHQTNAAPQEYEALLIDGDFKTLLNNQLKPLVDDFKAAACKLEDIITGMVKLNDGMGNEVGAALSDRLDGMSRTMKECTRQYEEFANLMGSAASKIYRLEEDFYAHRDIVVGELRRHDKEIKDLRKQVVQQSQLTSEHGHPVCVSDTAQ